MPDTTVREILDGGMPTPDLTDLSAGRTYGMAYKALTGTVEAPTNLGTFYRRVGEVLTLLVSGGRASAPPGVVVAVENLTAEDPTPLTIVLTRAPNTGEARVEPQLDGTTRITTNADDAITSVAVYGLWMPAEMIAALDSTP